MEFEKKIEVFLSIFFDTGVADPRHTTNTAADIDPIKEKWMTHVLLNFLKLSFSDQLQKYSPLLGVQEKLWKEPRYKNLCE